MRKFLIQFCIFLILFFGTWYGLSRIPFTHAINFKQLSKSNEHTLGKKFLDFLKNEHAEIKDDSVLKNINAFKFRLCEANDIDTSETEICILQNSEINAFALPGNILVIYTGLIDFCKTPEELASVMAHELAHIEKRHVTKKLSKDVGIGVLTTLATGNSGSQIIKEMLKRVSSTAFDREMEKEADFVAVHYLVNANIDPEQFATMMTRLAKTTDIPESMQWLNTHPNSINRATEIRKARKDLKIKVVPLMDQQDWLQLQKDLLQ